jgi:hypothetical protein
MGTEQDVTIGEIHRAVQRIERKVDDQGEVITSVNLRLTAIEARQPSLSKPLMAGGGIGAAIYGAVQWISQHWGRTP